MIKKYRLHSFFDETPPLDRPCDYENCSNKGEFKAPRSRTNLHDYLWFCLPHIRLYNENWNYYQGMTSIEVEREMRWNETWQRPTWPFTQRVAPNLNVERARQEFLKSQSTGEAERPPESKFVYALNSSENEALICMEMTYPYTKTQLKKRYLTLAKQHHPDINKGSKNAEEQLKKINLAYALLKNLIS